MAKGSSGFVAGLTAAAVAVVGFLAYQASASAPGDLHPKAKDPSTSPSSPASPGAKVPPKDPLALPANSGRNARVVYALAERRVWLVEEKGNKVARTFAVMPSAVNPAPGSYSVRSRSGSVRGSDGVQIEHVVRFANVEDVAIGFSAAVDGTMASPDPARKTGGIRMKREDGDALWEFATIGKKVVVLP
ncbi:L,D-transpeptidase [Streptomyces sp. NPDC001941]|uniref:L,D-transpeptidase n=1 Tax=Streptomyces sp. NPDC001941 TaxID=3154659 RepID=UPI00331652E7